MNQSIEWIAAIATILSVIFLSEGKLNGWIIGLAGSLIYGWIFIQQKLYANAVIQLIFLTQGFVGIYEWSEWGKQKKDAKFSSKKLDSHSIIKIIALTLFLAFSLSFIMIYFTDNKSPMLDTILSVFSITALMLMVKKIVQAWLFWIVIDLGYIYLFLSIGLWVSAGLYLLLLFLCIEGYFKWKKKNKLTYE